MIRCVPDQEINVSCYNDIIGLTKYYKKRHNVVHTLINDFSFVSSRVNDVDDDQSLYVKVRDKRSTELIVSLLRSPNRSRRFLRPLRVHINLDPLGGVYLSFVLELYVRFGRYDTLPHFLPLTEKKEVNKYIVK